ncbi:hypothetical protein DFJ73DRAFT_620798 [Zopfochytrium polystomum]|nr:hypothetical protein DFJ73DRAFT_620798 [Zopfochytrium polystomum]
MSDVVGTENAVSPSSPDRKRSLEDESTSDDDGSRGGRFKRQAVNSTDAAHPSPPKREEPQPDTAMTQPEADVTLIRNVTLRALVFTKEAGIVIGTRGKNIADIREQSGAKVMISENLPGVMERILTISGPIDTVAKAFSLVATKFVEEQQTTQDINSRHTSVRLLIPHSQMGSVIGKQGSKIKEFQELSGAKIVAAEELLPNSTERTVTMNGVIASIHIATYHIGMTLLEHPERSSGTVFYKPMPPLGSGALPMGGAAGMRGGMPGSMVAAMGYGGHGMSHGGAGFPGGPSGGHPAGGMQGGFNPYGMNRGPGGPPGAGPGGMMPMNQMQQQIFIPSDMVGAIIGKGGAKINEIRQTSGCQIKVAEDPRDGSTERLVTIMGTPEANQMALFMLYQRLEAEKARLAMQPHPR